MTPTPAAQPELTAQQLEQIIRVRRDLHEHPQAGYAETYASETITRLLTQWDVPFEAGVATTGVVAWLTPTDAQAAARPAVALRADMDALPIQEATGLPYASQYAGWMHACGHDGHTAILLGAVQCLAAHRQRLTRPVKFLFQPAEEVGAGAVKMIEQGVLTARFGGAEVGSVAALHNWPQLPQGAVAIAPGPAMAGTQIMNVALRGCGGHAAMPHLACDLNLAAAAFIQAVQSVVSRGIAPTDAAVVSICRIAAGDAHNVLPSRVELAGTIRFFTGEVRQRVEELIRRIAAGVGMAYGCEIEPTWDAGYPPTVNDAALASQAAKAAQRAGLEVLADEPASMAAEDFAFFGQQTPAVYMRLGATPAGENGADLHTDGYDFNDELIAPGVALLVGIVLETWHD